MSAPSIVHAPARRNSRAHARDHPRDHPRDDSRDELHSQLLSSRHAIPYLCCADAEAALEFYVEVFGFRERGRLLSARGGLLQAELVLEDAPLLLTPSPGALVPTGAGQRARLRYPVRELDAHHARARAAGATIDAPPGRGPDGRRRYRARDREQRLWTFFTPDR